MHVLDKCITDTYIHTLMVPSPEPENTSMLRESTATPLTGPLWPECMWERITSHAGKEHLQSINIASFEHSYNFKIVFAKCAFAA